MDVGELRIIVPRNTAVSVNAHAKVGDLYILNQHDSGRNVDVTRGAVQPAGDRRDCRCRPGGHRQGNQLTHVDGSNFEAADATAWSQASAAGWQSGLAVDATLVRLVFAILALAGGAGILLYFALWVYDDGRRLWAAAALVAAAAVLAAPRTRAARLDGARRRPDRRRPRGRPDPRRLDPPRRLASGGRRSSW